jgi:DNA repair protein RecN (Recombination protein N)
LGEYESSFRAYLEGLESARATLEDLAFSLREFCEKLEFSPARLAEIENRLAGISQLKRKYGGSIETALEHQARAQDRLQQIEHADERIVEVTAELAAARDVYLECAGKLHKERLKAAKKFEQAVEQGLMEVAMENAKFAIQISAPPAGELKGDSPDKKLNERELAAPPDAASIFTACGIDRVEFHFSANPGEAVKPLARVASGGEASRLMLVLKTVANASEFPRTIVFDEIDTGIGGRVSEAVGLKLKSLAQSNQVLCVTHQAQIARFADTHLLVQKQASGGHTAITIASLDRRARVEEIARMLTGSEITDSARRHAREMIKT